MEASASAPVTTLLAWGPRTNSVPALTPGPMPVGEQARRGRTLGCFATAWQAPCLATASPRLRSGTVFHKMAFIWACCRQAKTLRRFKYGLTWSPGPASLGCTSVTFRHVEGGPSAGRRHHGCSAESPRCAWQCGRVWDPWLSASNSRTLSSFKAQAWRADACQVCAARVEEQWPWGVGGKCWGRAQACGASGSQEGDRGKGPRIKVRRACGILSMLSFLPLPGRRT